jgi:DNA (cytosine-5)-methyltransferase 1
MKYKFIDLFAGAGGFTTGFHLAGWESLCAVELNQKALATYQYNYPNTKIINQDICNVDPVELRSLLNLQREELTALIGGPPCQGFSRNIPAAERSLDESRNYLYKIFLDFVQEFRPIYVVMENVPEILKAYDGLFRNEITKQLESFGYKVVSVSLNAAHYGIPQTRTRAFFIASLNELPVIPQPTHFGDTKTDYRIQKNHQQLSLGEVSIDSIITVRDAIGDLPPLDAGQQYDNLVYPSLPKSAYQQIIRHQSQTIVNHVARALTPIQTARACILKEGQDARDLPVELAPKKHYSGAYGRLYWDKPARTITRWLFHPGSGRFFHPTQNRTITIREAARLHSFPDNFHFLGTYTQMSSQIGESVPPLLAKAIATSLIRDCQKENLDQFAVVRL